MFDLLHSVNTPTILFIYSEKTRLLGKTEEFSTSWPSSSGLRGHIELYFAILDKYSREDSREDTSSPSRWTCHVYTAYITIYYT
jgi:hypothetical protein